MLNSNDKRPDPKPRKRVRLWQAYLIWDELVDMRKAHTLRISSIEKGKSNMDIEIEQRFLERLHLDDHIDNAKKFMIEMAEDTTPDTWEWVTSIKGLGAGSLAARLIAQIDDIGKFATVSKLWRYSGFAVIDGKAEKNKRGEKSHKNSRLCSTCWLIGEQFIRQQTPLYSEIYYNEKERQRNLHPVKIMENGKTRYNDGHIHNMARRKTIKIFLQHLWVKWREAEGHPVTKPYVQGILGHDHIIPPHNH